MPWPAGPVQAGVKGENAALHLWVDGTAEAPKQGVNTAQANAVPIASFMEMLLGHRSGGKNLPAAFLGNGSTRFGQGGTVTYAAGTITDTNQNWGTNIFGASGNGQAFGVIVTDATGGGQYNVILSNTATVLTLKSNFATTPGAGAAYSILGVADQNQGASVSYAAGPANALVDTGKAWTVNQWRGRWVMVSGQLRLIVSNTATQLTLDAAWSSTPSAQQAYFIADPLYQDWNTSQRGTTGGYTFGGPDMNPNNF